MRSVQELLLEPTTQETGLPSKKISKELRILQRKRWRPYRGGRLGRVSEVYGERRGKELR